MNIVGIIVSLFSVTVGILLWIGIWYLIVYFNLGSMELLKEYHVNRMNFPEQQKVMWGSMIVMPILTVLILVFFKKILNKFGVEVIFDSSDRKK